MSQDEDRYEADEDAEIEVYLDDPHGDWVRPADIETDITVPGELVNALLDAWEAEEATKQAIARYLIEHGGQPDLAAKLRKYHGWDCEPA